MHTFLIGKDEKSAGVLKLDQSITGLFELLDTDVKFSEARCSKVLPLALATYQEGLPLHYTRDYHESRVYTFLLLCFNTKLFNMNNQRAVSLRLNLSQALRTTITLLGA